MRTVSLGKAKLKASALHSKPTFVCKCATHGQTCIRACMTVLRLEAAFCIFLSHSPLQVSLT